MLIISCLYIFHFAKVPFHIYLNFPTVSRTLDILTVGEGLALASRDGHGVPDPSLSPVGGLLELLQLPTTAY